MEQRQKKIGTLIRQAIEHHTLPGAAIGYIVHGHRTVLSFGHTTYESDSPQVTPDTIYDLASVTKAIPVSSIILILIERSLLSLDDKVMRFIPEISNSQREKLLIKHLLTYTMAFDMPKSLSAYATEGGKALLNALLTAPLQAPPGQEYCYSNAPAIILGLIAERILDKPLDLIANELFFKPLAMHSTTFYPKKLHKVEIAPSEINWRGQIKGVVHDEAAWAIQKAGIVAGDAGLFSNAEDMLNFGAMLLNNGTFKGHRYFDPSTIKQMHTNQIAYTGKIIGLGWELNQPRFMGQHSSESCFGKVGFTGTMILVDPVKHACLVLLTNRTYPHRPPDGTAIDHVRCALADIVFA